MLILSSTASPPAHAYSVLSHEEVVDLCWKDQMVPLLIDRFPDSTPDQLRGAHGYAYGGSIIQDLGYYPFGSHLFSDLVHYVRTGDFVANLVRESSDINEYAFALGALAHYTGDSYGHPAINLATGDEYPKLRRKFGRIVTYDDNPTAHVQTEFGFDVVQVAENHYAPEQFHDFIGFQVSKPVLERAFKDTYGFELNQILRNEDLAIGTYRRTISGLIPKMTEVALVEYRDKIQNAQPSFDEKKFLYRVSRSEYEKEWGSSYRRPGAGARVLAFFLKILPKIGPLKALALRMPDNDEQQAFTRSMNETVDHYRIYAAEIPRPDPSARTLELPDRNLDTGKPTEPGEYRLADFTYAKLLDRITKEPGTEIPPKLRTSILAYYGLGQKNYLASSGRKWRRVQSDLKRLESTAAPAKQDTAESSSPATTPGSR